MPRLARLDPLAVVLAAGAMLGAGRAVPSTQPATARPEVVAVPGGLAVTLPAPSTVGVPAGPFTMGALDEEIAASISECQAEIGVGGACDSLFDDERPARRVHLHAFAIDRTEVTRGAYRACVVAGACSPAPLAYPSADADRDRAPITFVTCAEAAAYCAWHGQRLPTEAEWEKAARGDDGRDWPWGADARPGAFNHGKYSEGGPLFDASDGSLLSADAGTTLGDRSPYGALDLAGNVREWVADWYGLPDGTDLVDPTGPRTGDERVVRGGSYVGLPYEGRTTWRWHLPPGTRQEDLGFRCAD